ncbi:hypothetical protein [Mycobacteroides abscessus]|uniref:hypothetical protein n=1 Tax=Mycobacteroides abscessus TaxID=36809 RepID=UPI0012FFE5A6|nr:hypothetical protein [Mycobacteroides abscessus]
MPPIPNLKDYIDTELKSTMSPADFEKLFGILLKRIMALLKPPPTPWADLADTIAYLRYHLDARVFPGANRIAFAQRVQHQIELQVGRAELYWPIAPIGQNRRHALRFIGMLFYTIPSIVVDFGAGSWSYEDSFDLLRRVVGSMFGPAIGVLFCETNRLDPTTLVRFWGGDYCLQVGNPRLKLRTPDGQTKMSTWNMQGASSSAELKWLNGVKGKLIKDHPDLDIIAVQECTEPPPSSTEMPSHKIQDQFGIEYEVEEYLWNTGTTQAPKFWSIYYMKVPEADNPRCSYAILINGNRPFPLELDGNPSSALKVISHGGDKKTRTALGVRVRRPAASAEETQPFTAFSFHSFGTGGNDSRWIVTEVDVHVGGPWSVIGDFNRNPPAQGEIPWVSPHIAQLVPPKEATRAANKYDYLAASPHYVSVTGGDVQSWVLSDHHAVVFFLLLLKSSPNSTSAADLQNTYIANREIPWRG